MRPTPFSPLIVQVRLLFLSCFSLVSGSDYYGNPFRPGPTFGWAVVAWLLGTAGAVAVLVLRRRVAPDQDGPFRKCMTA